MNPMTNHNLGQMTHAEYEGRYKSLAPASTASVMPKIAYFLTSALILLIPFAL